MAENVVFARKDRVVTATLNRPEALNALNSETMLELVDELAHIDRDPGVGCFVIQGSGKAFAAGADIKEMASKTFSDAFIEDFLAPWDRFAELRTPKVAAVGGYALGGGCELAMMCDFIIASNDAKFGQPEVKLGTIPGMGGSQRLTRLVGRAKAMDMIMTGRTMDAAEAERSGLVARVVGADAAETEVEEVARLIASFSKVAVIAGREAVLRAQECSLSDGVRFERRLFHALFSTADQREGMAAFIEKRKPSFVNR